MKAESYDALATLNRSFDAVLESMKTLHQEGVLSADFVEDQTVVTEELRAVINFMIAQRFTSRESEDCDHFSKMRIKIEERRKLEATPTVAGRAHTPVPQT